MLDEYRAPQWAAFDAARYELSMVRTIRDAYPIWQNVCAWSGDLDVFADLVEQTVITIADFDYTLPNLPDDVTGTFSRYNNYIQINGRAYLSEPLTAPDSIFTLKQRVAQFMALIPLMNLEGGQRVCAEPLSATPIFEPDVPLGAYIVEWFDIVECDADAVKLTTVDPGLIARVGFGLPTVLSPGSGDVHIWYVDKPIPAIRLLVSTISDGRVTGYENISGLPDGVSFVDGVISGTPTVSVRGVITVDTVHATGRRNAQWRIPYIVREMK